MFERGDVMKPCRGGTMILQRTTKLRGGAATS